MPNHLTAGLFEANTDLDEVIQDLIDQGFDRNDIAVWRAPEEARAAGGTSDKGLITLFPNQPIPDTEVAHFSEGIRRGGAVVSVTTASQAGAEEAADILDRHGAIDIEEHATRWRQAGWQMEKGREAASVKAAEVLSRAINDDYPSGRTRGSRIFVW
jgi:hypothetical protein